MISKKTKRNLIRICALGFMAIAFLGLAFVNNYVINKYKDSLYVKDIIQEPTQAVYSETSSKNNTNDDVIIPPYVGDNVEVTNNFYDKDDNEDSQKKAIIHFDTTYLPSTGILYTSDETFDVIAVYDGTIIDIKKDNILGNSVVVKHNNNLITTYYSLEDINLKVNDVITQGQILGSSGKNKISNGRNGLYFEVSYQNELINPTVIYNQKVKNFS